MALIPAGKMEDCKRSLKAITWISLQAGRVVILSEYWFIKGLQDRVLLKMGDGIHCHAVPPFKEEYSGPAEINSTRESVCAGAQGLINGKHTFELIAENSKPPKIEAIRIYQPPMN